MAGGRTSRPPRAFGEACLGIGFPAANSASKFKKGLHSYGDQMQERRANDRDGDLCLPEAVREQIFRNCLDRLVELSEMSLKLVKGLADGWQPEGYGADGQDSLLRAAESIADFQIRAVEARQAMDRRGADE